MRISRLGERCLNSHLKKNNLEVSSYFYCLDIYNFMIQRRSKVLKKYMNLYLNSNLNLNANSKRLWPLYHQSKTLQTLVYVVKIDNFLSSDSNGQGYNCTNLQKIGLSNLQPHFSVMVFGNIDKPKNVFVFFHNKITSTNF